MKKEKKDLVLNIGLFLTAISDRHIAVFCTVCIAINEIHYTSTSTSTSVCLSVCLSLGSDHLDVKHGGQCLDTSSSGDAEITDRPSCVGITIL